MTNPPTYPYQTFLFFSFFFSLVFVVKRFKGRFCFLGPDVILRGIDLVTMSVRRAE